MIIKRINGSIFKQSPNENQTAKEIIEEAIEREEDLTGLNLNHLILTGINFNNVNLENCSFIHTRLIDCSFEGANMLGTNALMAIGYNPQGAINPDGILTKPAPSTSPEPLGILGCVARLCGGSSAIEGDEWSR